MREKGISENCIKKVSHHCDLYGGHHFAGVRTDHVTCNQYPMGVYRTNA